MAKLRGKTLLLVKALATALVAAVSMMAMPVAAQTPTPSLSTDKEDYAPAEIVHVTGSSFAPGAYDVPIIRPNGSIVKGDGSFIPGWDITTVAEDGSLAYDYQLNGVLGTYEIRVYNSPWSGALSETPVAMKTFTDNTQKIEQCENGPGPTDPCNLDPEWISSNLGASNSSYAEGDSVPFRLLFDSLPTGSTTNTVTIQYGSLKGGKHAYDYLTTWDRTISGDPCVGTAPAVSCASPSTLAIPADPRVTRGTDLTAATSDDITPVAGNFTMYGATLTSVENTTDCGSGGDSDQKTPDPLSKYAYDGTYPGGVGGDAETCIKVKFTTNTITNPVLAFGGHIASRLDWGNGNSASTINGSPYHVSCAEASSGCNTGDVQINADAVIQPGRIKIIKAASPEDDTSFSFTASPSPLTNFALTDPSNNTKDFTNITNFTTYTITEAAVAGWSTTLGTPPCIAIDANGNALTGTSNKSSATGSALTINLEEGTTYTCTFTNTRQPSTLLVKKIVTNDNGGTAVSSNFTMSVTGSSPSPSSFAGSVAGTSVSLNPGAYSVGETGPSGYSGSLSADCSGTISAGQSKTCTVTNNDVAGSLTVIKHVVNDDGGTNDADDFTITVDDAGTNPPSFAGSETGTTISVDAGSYSVSEAGPSGYVESQSAGCSGTMPVGGEATCTITNNDNPAKVTVIKHVINDNGGTNDADDFSMTIDDPGTNPASFPGAESPGTTVNVDPGSYSVSETGPSGYNATFSADCSGTVANGQTKTCTITNNDIAPQLIVIKHVINDNGGTNDADDFTMSIDDPGTNPASFAGAESPGTATVVDPGSYTVTETGPVGYADSYSADCTGTIAIGQTKTCTVTNDDKAAKVTVIKHVINDNGGTNDADDFSMQIADPGTDPAAFPGAESPGTTVIVDPGTYSVSETGPSGYAASFSTDCTGTVAIGEEKTCTITNNDIAPQLTVIKHVINDSGGTRAAADFTMTIDDPGTNPASFAGAESPGATTVVDPGAYSVSETGPSGYADTYSADCAGSIAIGETKTCTVTNNDIAPQLTVIKHVINDDGGTNDADDFTMSIDDPGTNPASFAGAESPGTTVTVDPGNYSVSETGPSGYADTYSADCIGSIAIGETKTCTVTNDDIAPELTVIKHMINDDGGTNDAADFTMTIDDPGSNPASFAGAESPGTTTIVDPGSYSVTEAGPPGYADSYSADCTASIAIGETKTCTVTNDDIAPELTVIKHVVNDSGGTNAAADFTMSIDDPGTNPASFAGAESPGTTTVVDPGSYSVSETGPSGYADSYSADCNGSIAIGETKTCTVTNNDIAPELTVIKHVVNDDGGTNTADDFTMTVDDPGTNPTPFSGAESPGTTVIVDPGAYTVSESGPSGYAESQSADCSGSIAIGETKTCTVTNDDIAPELTVIKHVVNDDGGTKSASDFTMTIDDPGSNPASFPGAESPGTTVVVDPGGYTVTETGSAGYDDSYSADCTGSIAIGETKTCTVTNDDIEPKLIVIKEIVNNSGGGAAEADFTMTVTGTNPSPASFAGDPAGTAVGLEAGTYSVTESGPSGYTGTPSPDCSGSIAIGETKTCTFTNDDDQGTLVVIKHVVNDSGGTNVAADFKMSTNSTNPSVADGFDGAEAPGTVVKVDAGSYNVTETGPSGYADSYSADCSGTIANGATKTCTVTNDDIAPELTVIKHVINNSGGTNVAADFTMKVDDPGTNPADFPGAESPGTTVIVDPGTYSVSELGPSGYAASFSADCSGSIAIGEKKTCTVTNNDIAPELTVIKHVINDDGGTNDADDFTMTIDDPGSNPASFPGAESPGTTTVVDPGSYTVSESGPSGYAESQSADCASSIAIGEKKTCTITNDDIAPELTVIKHVVNDGGGTNSASDFTMSIDDPGTNPASFAGAESPGTTVTVDPGSYSVSETGPSGYAESQSADCTGSIAIGETKTCTVTNDDIAPELTVIKHVVTDSGGTDDAGDFTMTIDDVGSNPPSFPGAESPGTTVTIDPGSYSVSESGPSGYAESQSADCTGSIAIGEKKTCTITNDDIAPGLTVIKHVVNDGGGTNSAADFTMTIDDPGTNPASFAGAESPGTTTVVDPGSYSVSESGPSGYADSYSADCTASIAIGETKTCTVTNNDIAPELTVIKHVINDSGGTNDAADFTMTIDDPGADPASFAGQEAPGTTVTVDPGSYSVSESGPSGYAESQSADCTGSIAIGETKTCTVTNNDIAPELTVIKHVVTDSGGTNDADDFTMTIDDVGSNPPSFPGAEAPGTTVVVDPGSYSVSESGPSGYAESQSADCTGSIAIGEKKTCTITNDDIAPGLTVIKHVVNDGGGTNSASDFTMSIDDPGTNPASFAGAEAPGTTTVVDPGSYSVSETGPSGYADTYSADCTGSIAIGETKTCTVTNNDIAPELTVIKHVVTDSGGTNDASDFTMTIDDTGTDPASFPGAEAPGTTTIIDPGAYSVSESGPAGYAESQSADCSGSIAIGDKKTCTITNDDISPTLTVVKDLVPNSDTGLFDLKIDGVTQGSGGDNTSTGPIAVDAGVLHTVSEAGAGVTDLSDYVSTIGGDCNANGAITLALDEDKACTITNTRRGAIKVVKNELGQPTQGFYEFTVKGGPDPVDLAQFTNSFPNNNELLFEDLTPGAGYEVCEDVPDGWTSSLDPDRSGDPCTTVTVNPGGTTLITVDNTPCGVGTGAGINIKVTIDNVLQPGETFTISYTVTDANSPFTTTVDVIFHSGETEKTVFVPVPVAGNYIVTQEPNAAVPPGPDGVSVSVTPFNNSESSDFVPCQAAAAFAAGFAPPTARVVKTTIPSGSQGGWQFNLRRNGVLVETGVTNGNGAINFATALNEADYTVREVPKPGFTLVTSAGCTFTVDLPADADRLFVCRATNSQLGSLNVIKTEKLPSGKVRPAIGKWEFQLSGGPGTGFARRTIKLNVAPRTNSFQVLKMKSGVYTLCEKAFPGWKSTFGGYSTSKNSAGATCAKVKVTAGKRTTVRVQNACTSDAAVGRIGRMN